MSLHGGREIEGLIEGDLKYASHPVPGRVDVAMSLWAYCAGEWEMMKIILASVEYNEEFEVKDSTKPETIAIRSDQENREAVMRQVLVAQFGRVRKTSDKKGAMKFNGMGWPERKQSVNGRQEGAWQRGDFVNDRELKNFRKNCSRPSKT